jgi:hypothetical protein
MPNPNHTRIRGVRIEDDPWDGLEDLAAPVGSDRSKLINAMVIDLLARCAASEDPNAIVAAVLVAGGYAEPAAS